MARDQHSRVYSCILLTPRGDRCLLGKSLFTGTLSTGGSGTHTGHTQSRDSAHKGTLLYRFYRYRYRYSTGTFYRYPVPVAHRHLHTCAR